MQPNTSGAPCAGPTCPVLADALLTCRSLAGSLTVAPGPGKRGYVAFSTNLGAMHPRLFTIDPDGQSGVESLPLAAADGAKAVFARVTSTAAGEPQILADYERPAPSAALMYAGFHAEWLTRGPGGTWTASVVGDGVSAGAAVDANGASHALLAGGVDVHANFFVSRATQTSPGATWIRTSETERAVHPLWALAADPAGAPHVIFREGSELRHRAPGAAPRALGSVGFITRLGAAVSRVGGAAEPVVSFIASGTPEPRTEGLRLLVPTSGTPSHREISVPDTEYRRPLECPSWATDGGVGSDDCSRPDCTLVRDDGVNSAAVAATDDGVAYVAYGHAHVDVDLSSRGRDNVPGCVPEVTGDRSTMELVVARVVTGAAPATKVVFRVPLPQFRAADVYDVALGARGTRLYAAVLGRHGSSGAIAVRYVVLDVGTLP